MSLSRRALLALPLAACSRRKASGFPGYAFVANEEGKAVAAVDLTAFAVVKHLRLDAAPSSVLVSTSRPAAYILTPETGSVHEISTDKLIATGRIAAGQKALSMWLTPDQSALYVVCREPRQMTRIALNPMRVEWKMPLPGEPVDFALSANGAMAAVSSAGPKPLHLLDLESRAAHPLGLEAEIGAVRFLSNSRTLIAADRGARRLSIYDVATRRLATHLPLSVRPDHLCFNADGGQLFVTGEGMDAVVVVYPYFTPQVAGTVLAGHSPGAMAASANPPYLFVANPKAGDVSILDMNSLKVIASVPVGADPGFITVTPDDQYALVLNRQSGDMAVVRIAAVTANRTKSAPLFTMIPVGSRPVSVAVRAV